MSFAILISQSFIGHYMFWSNWPSSGVQVIVVKDFAAHCNAGRPTHNRTPAPARTFKAATTKPKATLHNPKTNKTDGNPHNQNNQRQLQ
jgi:hypothetical protein